MDRKKTSKNFEDGLASNLDKKDSFEAFYDAFEENKGEAAFLKRKLDGYFSFCKKYIRNSYLIEQNFFFNAYIRELSKIKIGVVGLNSVWRSSGFGNDEKRLIIGSRVVEKANEFIKDCHLKLAIAHHPFPMLTPWDQKSLKNSMAQNINIFFTGHIHDSDFIYEKPILGKLYLSTAGAIFQGRVINGYSILNLNLAQKSLTVYLRRWYDNRGEFDQETEKCELGKVVHNNFELDNKAVSKLIEICNVKDEMLKYSSDDAHFLKPIMDIHVKLNDIFVEPILSDESSYEKSKVSKNIFDIQRILEKDKNLIFFGRKEFGKTSLLKYLGDYILRNDSIFEDKIPVYVSFSELPSNNYRTISRIILSKMHKKCNLQQVEKYLEDGNIILLIDDYDSVDVIDREKKLKVLNEFITTYNQCRFFLLSPKPLLYFIIMYISIHLKTYKQILTICYHSTRQRFVNS